MCPLTEHWYFVSIFFPTQGKTALHFQLGYHWLYQPQVCHDFPVANKNLVMWLCCPMKDNSNTSIRHRYPYHEGEEATALRKEKWEARKGRRKRDATRTSLRDGCTARGHRRCGSPFPQGDSNLSALKWTSKHYLFENSLSYLPRTALIFFSALSYILLEQIRLFRTQWSLQASIKDLILD